MSQSSSVFTNQLKIVNVFSFHTNRCYICVSFQVCSQTSCKEQQQRFVPFLSKHLIKLLKEINSKKCVRWVTHNWIKKKICNPMLRLSIEKSRKCLVKVVRIPRGMPKSEKKNVDFSGDTTKKLLFSALQFQRCNFFLEKPNAFSTSIYFTHSSVKLHIFSLSIRMHQFITHGASEASGVRNF